MVAKCTACGKFMTSAVSSASCIKCNGLYHLACVGILEKNKIATGWACPECKAKMPRNNKDDTPIKSTTERGHNGGATGSKTCVTPDNTVYDITEDSAMVEELKLFREVFREELSAMRNEMQEVRRELSNISSSLLICNKRVDDIESKVTRVEKECKTRIDNLESRLAIVEKQAADQGQAGFTGRVDATILQLKTDLNDRDQELLLNDIEITGIPEEKVENVIHITTVIAAKIGVSVSESDIVRADRVGPVRGSRNDQVAARPIVVRLTRRALRDDLLRAARVRRGATTSDMNLPGPTRRFYVNERLTKYNRQLFNKARAAAKNCKWKFTWSRDGRIYTRKDESQSGARIRSDQDIIRIFGNENIEAKF